MTRVLLLLTILITALSVCFLISCNSSDGGNNEEEDTTPPKIILLITAEPAATSCVISWTTDEEADSVVEYGLNVGLGYVESNAAYTKEHDVFLIGLKDGFSYDYRISSTDRAGNTVRSSIRDFSTLTDSNLEPTACFEVTPLTGSTSLNFIFDAGCSNDPEDGSSLRYRWDWEDDKIWDTDWYNTPMTTHLFNTKGLYEVKLQVMDSAGAAGVDERYVNVSDVYLPIGEMVRIPAGSFVMGDTFYGDSRSSPTRTVELDEYWIGQYEITNREYVSILNWALYHDYLEDGNGGVYTGGDVYTEGVRLLEVDHEYCKVDFNGLIFIVESAEYENHSVSEVSWYGAVMYCNWLSDSEGKTACYDTGIWECDFSADGYRLPTEAEWEKAAGHDPDKDDYQSKRLYPWGDELDDSRLSCGSYSPSTVVVGRCPNNASYYTCLDMEGNVSEWCYDWWQDDYSGFPDPDSNPTGPASGAKHVVRGGAWHTGKPTLLVAYRNGYPPMNPNLNLGFRIARSE